MTGCCARGPGAAARAAAAGGPVRHDAAGEGRRLLPGSRRDGRHGAQTRHMPAGCMLSTPSVGARTQTQNLLPRQAANQYKLVVVLLCCSCCAIMRALTHSHSFLAGTLRSLLPPQAVHLGHSLLPCVARPHRTRRRCVSACTACLPRWPPMTARSPWPWSPRLACPTTCCRRPSPSTGARTASELSRLWLPWVHLGWSGVTLLSGVTLDADGRACVVLG